MFSSQLLLHEHAKTVPAATHLSISSQTGSRRPSPAAMVSSTLAMSRSRQLRYATLTESLRCYKATLPRYAPLDERNVCSPNRWPADVRILVVLTYSQWDIAAGMLSLHEVIAVPK